jgi:hypothetical protein
VQRCAVAGARDDFNERIYAVCVGRGQPYQAMFARPCS